MKRRLSITVASAVVALSALAACGGGGGGSSPVPPGVALPTMTPTSAATPAPIVTGFVAATGAITLLNGAGGAFGSTILNGTNTAVFLGQSAATPDSVAVGGSLPTSGVTVSETGGQSTSARLRSVRSLRPAQPFVRDADSRRVPDALNLRDKDRAIYQAIRHTASIARSAQATRRLSSAPAPANFAPGAAYTFQIQSGNISGTSSASATPIPVAAHLITQTTHANVWLDDKDANSQEYPSGIPQDMAVVGKLFEQNYNVETSVFGPAYTTATVQFSECDANTQPLTGTPDPGTDTTGKTDPQINIVITNALAGTGEGGYFFGADMLSQSEANCIPGTPKVVVNNLKMFVMTSDINTPSTDFAANNEFFYLNETVPQTMAHEYQHYLHYINKVLQQTVVDPANGGTYDNSFIDEGSSVLAQDLVVAPNGRDPRESETPLFVRLFELEPDLFSLTSFSGFQPDPASSSPTAPYNYYHNTAGNYGLSYLFLRYLYDRFGPSALQRIYAEKYHGTGVDVGPAVAAANGEPFTQLYDEFATAVGVHAGGSGPEITNDPRFSFSSTVVLRGLTTTFSRRMSSQTRYIVQPGPENPEIFAGNLPKLDANNNPIRQALSPGQTITLNLIAGATYYLTPTGTPTSGATVRASSAAPAFQGALGQGPIPTPTPAYY